MEKKFLLQETIGLFESSNPTEALDRMSRGLQNDIFKIFERFDREIHALPTKYQYALYQTCIQALEAQVDGMKRRVTVEYD